MGGVDGRKNKGGKTVSKALSLWSLQDAHSNGAGSQAWHELEVKCYQYADLQKDREEEAE
jgi:hypothetical protein